MYKGGKHDRRRNMIEGIHDNLTESASTSKERSLTTPIPLGCLLTKAAASSQQPAASSQRPAASTASSQQPAASSGMRGRAFELVEGVEGFH